MNWHHTAKRHAARTGTEYRYGREMQRMDAAIAYETDRLFGTLDPWYDDRDWEQYWDEEERQGVWFDVPVNSHCNCSSCYDLRKQGQHTVYCSETWA